MPERACPAFQGDPAGYQEWGKRSMARGCSRESLGLKSDSRDLEKGRAAGEGHQEHWVSGAREQWEEEPPMKNP